MAIDLIALQDIQNAKTSAKLEIDAHTAVKVQEVKDSTFGKVVTQAEYDLLGDVVNTDDVVYIIQG